MIRSALSGNKSDLASSQYMDVDVAQDEFVDKWLGQVLFWVSIVSWVGFDSLNSKKDLPGRKNILVIISKNKNRCDTWLNFIKYIKYRDLHSFISIDFYIRVTHIFYKFYSESQYTVICIVLYQ